VSKARDQYPNHPRDNGPGDGPPSPDFEDGMSDPLLDALRADLAAAVHQRDEAIAARQRALADFSNFQRRANDAEIRAANSGAARVIRALLNPLDHFDLALGQEASKMTIEQLLRGVQMARQELARALDASGVTTIVPQRGDEFDAQRHEAMLREAAPGVPADHVVATLQPGYVLGDMVLRPAKVSLSLG